MRVVVCAFFFVCFLLCEYVTMSMFISLCVYDRAPHYFFFIVDVIIIIIYNAKNDEDDDDLAVLSALHFVSTDTDSEFDP